jgi:predicted methyltransferase
MKNPEGANIVLAETPTEAPIPEGVHDLDLITLVLNYHDITFTPVDRGKMNKAMFDGLKHGGALVIVDHAARPGDGVSVASTLHRIEESTLISEIEAAGFRKAAEADFLRQPNDPRDKPFFKMDGQPSDQFVLKFVKP